MTAVMNSALKPDCEEKLYDYQIKRVNRIYQEFVDLNQTADFKLIKVCPKCGVVNPKVIKGGHANSGKPMYKCCVCGKRFVSDNGTLTFYSHQDASKWSDFIKETMSGKSIAECAALINVSIRTAFRMKHKLMDFLNEAMKLDLEDHPLSNEVECDETYYHESHKGLKDKKLADIEDEIYWNEHCPCGPDVDLDMVIQRIDELTKEHERIRLESRKKKRGISSDLACVITGIERQGVSSIMATNMAKPTSDDIRKATAVIEDGSFVFIDGATAYISVLEEKHCNYSICPSDESYDAVNHMNTVNSLHSKMGEWMRRYRGVSTIYLNRYAALFHFAHKFRDCDAQERTLLILRELHNIHHYFYDRQMHSTGIFDDPQVMDHRSSKVSIWYQIRNRHRMKNDMRSASAFA